MSDINFSQFLESLGAFESGIDTTQTYSSSELNWLNVFVPELGGVDPATVDTTNPDDLASLQYHVHNTLGFLGKYQFGEPLLIDLGYYTPAPTGYYGSTATNEWQGTWTGKNGVESKEDFMSVAQELAIREAFAMNMKIIEQRLEQAGKSLDDFIGNEFTYTQGGVTQTAVVSMSGILASAHLQGPGGVANLLLNNAVSHDEYGTNILSYMDKFGGFQTPFGSSTDDFLSGSDYSETFAGATGNNIYETGGGYDNIVLSDNPGAEETVTDFDLAKDVISLGNFDGVTFSDLSISQLANGDALIALPNGQTVVLQNIDASQINATHFVQGTITLSWNAMSGDTVVQNFNLQHDLIDLNYAFGSNNLSLYDENGSAVIEVIGNEQRLIIEDVPLSELSAFHFIKAPLDFATVFFSAGSVNEPPVDQGDSGGTSEPPVSTEPPVVEPAPDPTPTGDIVSFTWNWGSNAVVNNFDLENGAIDLQSFWTSYDNIKLYDNSNGNAVIDLIALNNQTITLDGVAVAQLTSQHFIGLSGSFNDIDSAVIVDPPAPPVDPEPTPEPPPEVVPDPTPEEPTNNEPSDNDVFTYTWDWGSNHVIDDFDADNDVVDLSSFWTDYNSFEIYESNGDTLIDLSGINNQTIRIDDLSLSDLSGSNIVGVSGNFNDSLTESPSTPPPPSSIPSDETVDTYSFTWNWGKNTVLDDFNPQEDVIDLKSFWTSEDNIEIFENAQGDTVISLMAINNQTITLEGVSKDQLGDDNIVF